MDSTAKLILGLLIVKCLYKIINKILYLRQKNKEFEKQTSKELLDQKNIFGITNQDIEK